MENVTLNFSEELLELSREYAEKQGKSLEQLISELLEQRVRNGQSNMAALLEHAEKNSKAVGYKWNREDAYER